MCALETAALDILTTVAPVVAAEGSSTTSSSQTNVAAGQENHEPGKDHRAPGEGKGSAPTGATCAEEKSSGLITEETIQKVTIMLLCANISDAAHHTNVSTF
jgi:hypothetical protein